MKNLQQHTNTIPEVGPGADLRGFDLRWADLRGIDLCGADLSGADLYRANLVGVNLVGAKLVGANLRGIDLSGADLSGAALSKVNLRCVDLSGANLKDADLYRVDLYRANLSGANLRDADLRGTNLIGANLSGVNLVGSNLSGANLSKANLSGADLSGANLVGAIPWGKFCRNIDDVKSSMTLATGGDPEGETKVENKTEERLSIYDAKRLGLSLESPLYQVLYDAYTAHQDLPAAVAYRAAEILVETPFVTPCHAIWMAEREIKPMNLVNLTPHAINLYDGDQLVATIPASGMVARANEEKKLVSHINGYPVSKISYGEIENLPEQQEDTMYIVSYIAATAAKLSGRTDCLSPDGLVRDEKGQIAGCRGFAMM